MAANKLINYIFKWDIDDFLWHVALFKYAQPRSQNITGTVGKYCHFQKCRKQGGGGYHAKNWTIIADTNRCGKMKFTQLQYAKWIW